MIVANAFLSLHLEGKKLQNTLLTVVCATFQGLALVWYVLTYIPGGERGLRFITSICTGTMKRQASSSSMLPI
uniref:Vesicle transport protein n=1 Tax=Bursaphelenchus xylophilus TaxID=6326 RepID=A0A1I7RW70_BURXY